MTSIIKEGNFHFKDKAGSDIIILPKTKAKLVTLEDGTTVEDTISSLPLPSDIATKDEVKVLENIIDTIEPFKSDWGNITNGLTATPNAINIELPFLDSFYTISNNWYNDKLYVSATDESYTVDFKTGTKTNVNRSGILSDAQICPIGDNKLLVIGWNGEDPNQFQGKLVDMSNDSGEDVGTGGMNGGGWDTSCGLVFDGVDKVYAINRHISETFIKMFDRKTKTWSTVGNLNNARYGTSVAYHNSKVYVYGSHDRYGDDVLEIFDTVSKVSTEVTNVPSATNKEKSSLTILSNIIYISNDKGLHSAKVNDLSRWTTLDSDIKTVALINDRIGCLYGWSGSGGTADNLTKYALSEIPITVSQPKTTTESLEKYTGIEGQIVVNTTDTSLHVMDGVTKGGTKLAKDSDVISNADDIKGLSNQLTSIQPFATDWGVMTSGSSEWKTNMEMTTGRHELTSSVIDSKIYVIGGVNGLTKVEIYDPKTSSWSTGADMPTGRYALTSSVIGSNIYVIGGQGGLNKVEIYNTISDSWTTGVDMPTGRYGLASSAINGKIYCTCGEGFSGIEGNI